jgi:2-amino-4-hydroxy-6-hydroxymethyldihydropteridine diphosphokinase
VSAFVVGLGSSGHDAEAHLAAGLEALRDHPALALTAASDLFQNPAAGGVTQARFVNAAAVVETALGPAALLGALHAMEAVGGRVRSVRWAARALDVDLLWGLDLGAPSLVPAVPHPRVLERSFATLPALEAIARAGRTPPPALGAAGRRLAFGARLLRTPLPS